LDSLGLKYNKNDIH
jgi:hypothetical protein